MWKITVKDGVASIRDLGNIQLVGDFGAGRPRGGTTAPGNPSNSMDRQPDTAWRDLVALDAITGGRRRRCRRQRSGTASSQWLYSVAIHHRRRYRWKNLMPLSDLEDGREVELKMTAAASLALQGDDAWRPPLRYTAPDGATAKQVELRVEGGYIQWKYDADSDWQNLLPCRPPAKALKATRAIKGDPVKMAIPPHRRQRQLVDRRR